MKLHGPLTVASGPLTSKLSLLKKAAEACAGAASLKLTFITPPFHAEMRSFSVHDHVILSPTEKRLALHEGVELCRSAKRETALAIWANFTGAGADEWFRLSEAFIDAGADGLELNFCCPNLDTSSSGPGVRHGAAICTSPELTAKIVRDVRRRFTQIPVMPKIVNNTHLFRDVAAAAADAGAPAVHVVGQPVSGAPPVNPDTLKPLLPFAEGVSFGSTNGSVCLCNTLRSVAEVRSAAPALQVMASGGITRWEDCVSAYAYGADAAAVCSAVMWHGWERLKIISRGLEDYFRRKGMSGPEAVRDTALKLLTPPSELKLNPARARIDENACVGCGKCAKVGHCEAITLVDRKARVDETACISCGVCRSLCPADAILYDDDPRYGSGK